MVKKIPYRLPTLPLTSLSFSFETFFLIHSGNPYCLYYPSDILSVFAQWGLCYTWTVCLNTFAPWQTFPLLWFLDLIFSMRPILTTLCNTETGPFSYIPTLLITFNLYNRVLFCPHGTCYLLTYYVIYVFAMFMAYFLSSPWSPKGSLSISFTNVFSMSRAVPGTW